MTIIIKSLFNSVARFYCYDGGILWGGGWGFRNGKTEGGLQTKLNVLMVEGVRLLNLCCY